MKGPEGHADGGESIGALRIVVERPPPGLARGRYESPAWVIGAIGATIVVLGLAFVVWRLGWARKR